MNKPASGIQTLLELAHLISMTILILQMNKWSLNQVICPSHTANRYKDGNLGYSYQNQETAFYFNI